MSTSPLLRLEKAAKFYGAKLVFRDVTCAVEPGQVMLVAGPNGAGKTTLLKVMAGLSRPSAGTVRLDVPPERTAYLGHATFLYPGLTALQNLGFWARMYGLRRSRKQLMEMLERVGLVRVAEERAGSFSRGMSQRLNLARVFLVDPALLFLDEPGTGLDVTSLALLRREIGRLAEAGTSIVWISHQVREDRELAHTVLALSGARMRYCGPAAEYEPEAVC
ncbi:heme exporter protein A [Paucidesulfovibrio gracilis DSM 16080]|uniref:Heme exporter protein A n=1 Tax=Paucidesulfovibrio gracilis DSM 16080 TaxID=1121449 RepID=A0A1T4W0T1_9BACT|nr:ABC transporter ATP-binding protein [Paucidesulfovibrio gracilis]SKA70884.1 heme exporter protein A [Paucidesulfovibrio gracilis DSM 16080]